MEKDIRFRKEVNECPYNMPKVFLKILLGDNNRNLFLNTYSKPFDHQLDTEF